MTPEEALAAAAEDTASEAQLVKAAQAGADAGGLYGRTGRRPACPYPHGSLEGHVWLRWLVRGRLAQIGVE